MTDHIQDLLRTVESGSREDIWEAAIPALKRLAERGDQFYEMHSLRAEALDGDS
jgi:hypothetical protein